MYLLLLWPPPPLLLRDMGYYYYTSTAEGQQYKLHCRRPVPASAGTASEADVMDTSLAEEVLLDENQRKAAGNFSFYMVRAVSTAHLHRRTQRQNRMRFTPLCVAVSQCHMHSMQQRRCSILVWSLEGGRHCH